MDVPPVYLGQLLRVHILPYRNKSIKSIFTNTVFNLNQNYYNKIKKELNENLQQKNKQYGAISRILTIYYIQKNNGGQVNLHE